MRVCKEFGLRLWNAQCNKRTHKQGKLQNIRIHNIVV